MKRSKNYFLMIIGLLFFSCKKTGIDSSIGSTLMRHSWHHYKSHEIVYDVGGISPIVTKDTSYFLPGCVKQSPFQFFKDNRMSYTDNCVVVPSVGLGQWQLSTNDSLVTAIIPRVITGQTYYFGLLKMFEGSILQVLTVPVRLQYTEIPLYFFILISIKNPASMTLHS